MKHKAEKREVKRSEYKIIQGEMDMTHRGQVARVQATFYPKKMVSGVQGGVVLNGYLDRHFYICILYRSFRRVF